MLGKYGDTHLRGSLEKPLRRLLIGVPMTGLLRAEWVVARYNQPIPTNWSQTERVVHLPNYSPVNYLVADARNSIVKFFIENDYEWLLFIDHDTIIPPNLYVKLNEYMRSREVPIVSGIYFTRSVPSEPLIYRGRGTSYYADWKFGDKVWVDGLPMGCTLLHHSILKALWYESPEYFYEDQMETLREVFKSPYDVFFDQEALSWHNASGTEDLYFCRRVIENGIFEKAGWPELQKKEFPFLVDTNIFCRHIEWDGRQFPLHGEECQFAICNIEGCKEQAVKSFNNFFWCEKHLPETLREKEKAK
jgi:hypothetical protein